MTDCKNEKITYLTTKEAAAVLRVSENTISNWAKMGRIPSKIIGSKILIPRSYVFSTGPTNE